MKFLFAKSLSIVLSLSILGSTITYAPTAAAEEVQLQSFSEVVTEMKYLLANQLVKTEEAVTLFGAKIAKLADAKVNVLAEAKAYALATAKSTAEANRINAEFDMGVKQIELINKKAEKDAMMLSQGDDIDEVKVAAIMRNARGRINIVTNGLMLSVMKSATGANFLGCSELNAKAWVGIGLIVLGTAITVVGLTQALMTEKGIIRRHDRARKRVNRKMDKQDAIIVETEARLIKEKAELEPQIAFYQDLQNQGVEYYTDDKGHYWNVNDRLSQLQTDLYWCNEELGNIDHYWWEDNTDRYYQLQDVDDSQREAIENLSNTHTIGYIMTGTGAAILAAGVVTGSLGIKSCR